MKKFLYTVLLVVFILHYISAQQAVIQLSAESNIFDMIDISSTQIRILQKTNHFAIDSVVHNATMFTTIISDGYMLSNDVGKPRLPVRREFVEVPAGTEAEIIIHSFEYTDIDLSKYTAGLVFPAQSPISKTNHKIDFKKDSIVYHTDSFYPQNIVDIEELGLMRSHHLAVLVISPFQYNPVTNILRIYNSLDFSVQFTSSNQKLHDKVLHAVPAYFNFVKQLTLNSSVIQTEKSIVSDAPVTYVIVSDPMFEQALVPFIEWKTQKGFRVIDVYTNNPEVGQTAASIRSYLSQLYHQPPDGVMPPLFLLLVGDIGQVSSKTGNTGSHVTDWYYADFTNDILPDIFVGRFSANSVEELLPQIEKTIMYEQYGFPNADFLNKALMISGVDKDFADLHGNGHINYGTEHYINQTNGITSYNFLYPASGSSVPQIKTLLNNGVGFANYTAHGSSQSWANPQFHVGDIQNMTNAGKYPLMIGNACQTGKFDEYACFGEALLRANNKGAVGYIGASNNTYWDEDYWWAVGYGDIILHPQYATTQLGFFDRLFHSHNEPQTDWFVTQSQIIVAGNLAVTQSGSSLRNYYWEVYHLFGDPSMMPYLSKPVELSATYPATIPLGATSLSVVTVPYAYVGLTQHNELLTASFANEAGIANLQFQAILLADTIGIVITAQNMQPHFGNVVPIQFPEAYVVPVSIAVNDEIGNMNGNADYSELIALDITVKNFGAIAGSDVNASITSANSAIQIIDDNIFFGSVTPFQTIEKTGFLLLVSDSVTDKQQVVVNITVSDNAGNSHTVPYNILIHAPVLKTTQLLAVASGSIDTLTYLTGTQSHNLLTTVRNIGSSASGNIECTISTSYSNVQISTAQYTVGYLESDQIKPASFQVILSVNSAEKDIIPFYLYITDGIYQVFDTLYISIGELIEDFETSSFEQFPWEFSSGTNSIPWFISTQDHYEGLYCAQSGSIGHEMISEMFIRGYVYEADSVSFYYKVSCEDSGYDIYWDYLEFSVNGIVKGKWAGLSDWEYVSYYIPIGHHTFSWKYVKDESLSYYEDNAKIDYIKFPARMIFLEQGTSVQIFDSFSEMIVFPNPATDKIFIELNKTVQTPVNIRITDIMGKSVIQKIMPAINLLQLDVSDLEHGVYILHINSDTFSATRKIIVSK